MRLICEQNTTLKEFTENNYAQASFFWSYLLKNKDIKVNGQKVGRDVALSVGDEVSYYLTDKQAGKPAFYSVYEDENILIVDKESGVNAEAVYSALRREKNCTFIHRLDRNTRGLIVFALNETAERELLSAFKNRAVEKVYHALCFGCPNKEKEILTAFLKKDAERSLVHIFGEMRNGTEKIVTEYQVLEKYEETTRLKIVLHTGKTHQIRAHLAYIGCPIVGDMKYGNSLKNKAVHSTRQQLVAYSLTFHGFESLKYLNGKTFYSRFDVEI